MSPSGSSVKLQSSALPDVELGSPAQECYWSCFSKQLESLREMAMGGGVATLLLETLPAVKEGIYDVYSKKVQPGRTWLSHYSSQSDIFYHLRGQRPPQRKHGSFQRPGGGWGRAESQSCGCQAGRALFCFRFSL